MKIGLYLQDARDPTNDYKNACNEYKQIIQQAIGLDLLVCPENTVSEHVDKLLDISPWDSFADGSDVKDYYSIAAEMATEAGCPIVYGHVAEYPDGEIFIYTLYCNPWASEGETKFRMTPKNTATYFSPLSFEDYPKLIDEVFQPILYKGIRIGITICYDNYYPLFSRAFGMNGMDILLNCTGGHVDYNKWSNMQRARAIENSCYALCTMSYDMEDKKNASHVFGYAPSGKCLIPTMNKKQCRDKIERMTPGSLYIYEFNPMEKDVPWESDERALQEARRNNVEEFFLGENVLSNVNNRLQKIDENLYVIPVGDRNVIISVIESENIYKPEKTAGKLYSKIANGFKNPCYVIINRWDRLDKKQFDCQVLNLIKVRAIENYCAVMLTSNGFSECFQSTDTKKAQRLKKVDGGYWLDLGRCTGPNALWRTKSLTMMRKEWRSGYEALLSWIIKHSSST